MSTKDRRRVRADYVADTVKNLFRTSTGIVNNAASLNSRHELYQKLRSSFISVHGPHQKEVDSKLAMIHKLFTLARRLDAFGQDVVTSVSKPASKSGKVCICVK